MSEMPDLPQLSVEPPLHESGTTTPKLSPSTTTVSSSPSSIHREVVATPGPGTGSGTPQRPGLGTRKSSGTIIVPRDHPAIEMEEGDEIFDENDARTMSPRRSSEDVEKIGIEARKELSKQAKALHESLLTIFNRIEAVKEEHDKLDSNNKFLQKYIGDLMSTSKITAGGAAGGRKK